MLIKVLTDVIVKSSLVSTLEIPVSVKQVTFQGKEGKEQVLTALAFRKMVAEAYEKRKLNSKDMPNHVPFENQVLTKQSVIYEDDDNVLDAVRSFSNNGFRGADSNNFKVKAKDDIDDAGKSIFDSYKVLGGALIEKSAFVALHVQPQDIKVVCFRPQTQLVNLLRNSVLNNDERLYQAVDKQQHNHYSGRAEGVRAFTIRFRQTELLRHAHAIADLLPKKKKKSDDSLTDDIALEEMPNPVFGATSSSFGFGGGSRRHQAQDLSPECSATLKELVAYLSKEAKEEHEKWDAVFVDACATFDSLSYLLSEGTEVVATTKEQHLQGGRVKSIQYQQSMYGAFWSVCIESVTTDGRSFMPLESTVAIADFSPKLKAIADLPIRPINAEQKKFLTERGTVFRKLAIGAHHLAYLGPLKISAWRHVRADGRIMVDQATFNEHNPDGRGFGGRSGRKHGSSALDAFQQQQETQNRKSRHGTNDGESDDCWDPLSDNLLFMTPPSIKAFSFRLHIWGDAYVVQMSEIEFREKAFKQLVLPEEQKDLIRAMVVNTRTQSEIDELARKQWNSNRLVATNDASEQGAAADDDVDAVDLACDDFVSNKGGGCVFLLSGPPGTGKTLTAEALSEVLKLPLYCVTTGELGTTASELEDRLRYVLDLAATWNCCILLDEADVFLSQRGTDVVRSGLVSIFLRVIEYHQGVVFLTTNLPENIDQAFASRINIALKYQPLGAPQRAKVWRNFLEPHERNGETFDYEKLSQHELNGRQIRSVYRVSIAMSRDKKIALKEETVLTAIKHSMQL